MKLPNLLRARPMRLGVLLFALAVLPRAGWAQASVPVIEEVVVTGSHLRGRTEAMPLPVSVLRREDLVRRGSPTTIDLINQLSFSQGADGETEPFQGFPGTGADRGSINIRGLGPSRSLVLVNGKRMTWSPLAESTQAQLLVDVHTIPAIALQRVELLRDGAAATYGSDAIAGVANFITRADFTGLEFNFNHKAISGSDGDNEFGIIWGQPLLNQRGQLVTAAGFARRNPLPTVERDWAVLPHSTNTRGGWSSVGRPAVFVPYAEFDATAGGTAGFLQAGIVDPNCERLGGAVTGNVDGGAGFPNGGYCRFQYLPFFNLVETTERWQWLTQFNYQLSGTTELALELLLANSEVPEWATSPSYPPNRLIDRSRSLRANNPGLVDMAARYPEVYGAYAACAAAHCSYQGDPWDEVGWFYGRYYGQDGPPRSNVIESETLRVAATLDGEWGDYGWQLSLSWSEAERNRELGDTMAYRDQRAREGLGGFECEQQVPNEYNAAGQLAFSRATLEQWAGQGPCRYWIPFSNGLYGSHPLVPNGVASNPDYNPALDNRPLFDYMLTNGVTEGATSLLVLEAVLNGDFGWELGGGVADFALGFQLRAETYKSQPAAGSFYDGVAYPCLAGPEIKDCSTGRTGLFNFLPPSFAIDEARAIYALFAELHLPLSDALEGQVSVRYEDYGGKTGATIDPKLALKWQLTELLSLRASAGTTFRGPTLNQTVASNSSNSLNYIAQTGAFKRVDTQGNPDLKPEAATTINIGLLAEFAQLFQPSDQLFVTLDYWSYDFTDPLVIEPFTRIVTLACPGPQATDSCDRTSPFYDRLVFGANDSATDLEIINVSIVNGPDYQTDGLDFIVRYEAAVGPGELELELSGTRILSYDIAAWQFGTRYDALGRANARTPLARALADWKAQFGANYNWQNFNLRWTSNYLSAYDYQGAPPQPAGDATVAAHLTHDLHASYTLLDEQLTLTASLINLRDEAPPYFSREFNYDPYSHNPLGRIFRLGVTYSL